MADIGTRLLFVEGRQIKARGDALVELSELRARQHAGKLRLAREDDLQQLLLVSFEVGEQTDLLQHLEAQMLCLVNHQYRAAIRLMIAQQELVQRVSQHLEAVCATGIVNLNFSQEISE